MTDIHVTAYAEPLLQAVANGQDYQEALETHAQQTFTREPWGQIAIRATLRAGAPPAEADPAPGLRALAESGMDQLARAELERLIALAAPGVETIECHLFPCLNPDRRCGFSYAPGKMLILTPLIPHWPLRLVRNITHEYSHTLRSLRWPQDERFGYGPAYRYTIREYLVFEGLAENLVEACHPHPDFPPPEVPPEIARQFWDAVRPHRELESWDAYRVFQDPGPTLPEGIGYAMGYSLVRSFLDRTGLSALAAHQLPYDEILPPQSEVHAPWMRSGSCPPTSATSSPSNTTD